MGAKIGRRNTLLLNNIFIATGILCQVSFRTDKFLKFVSELFLLSMGVKVMIMRSRS